MKKEYYEWLDWAIETIASGVVNKLEKYDTTVYRCGTIIRIDKKGVFKTNAVR